MFGVFFCTLLTPISTLDLKWWEISFNISISYIQVAILGSCIQNFTQVVVSTSLTSGLNELPLRMALSCCVYLNQFMMTTQGCSHHELLVLRCSLESHGQEAVRGPSNQWYYKPFWFFLGGRDIWLGIVWPLNLTTCFLCCCASNARFQLSFLFALCICIVGLKFYWPIKSQQISWTSTQMDALDLFHKSDW